MTQADKADTQQHIRRHADRRCLSDNRGDTLFVRQTAERLPDPLVALLFLRDTRVASQTRERQKANHCHDRRHDRDANPAKKRLGRRDRLGSFRIGDATARTRPGAARLQLTATATRQPIAEIGGWRREQIVVRIVRRSDGTWQRLWLAGRTVGRQR